MKLVLSWTPSAVPAAPFIFRGHPASQVLAIAAELGYDGVELHLRSPEDVDGVSLLREGNALGLKFPTIGTGLAAGLDGLTFASPDPAVRRRAVGRVKEHIELAAYLGSSVIIGSMSGRVGREEPGRTTLRAAALECVSELCTYAAGRGVTVLLEAINRYECDYLNKVQDVLDVIDERAVPNLQVLADTFHMNIEEVDIAAALASAGERLGHVHLADSNRQAAGHGHLAFAPVLRTLLDMNYQGYLSFEVFPLPTPEAAAADAIRTVKASLRSIAATHGSSGS